MIQSFPQYSIASLNAVFGTKALLTQTTGQGGEISMSVNFLHVSDLHRGMNEQGWLWPTVELSFFKELRAWHEDSQQSISAVIFTGDLVQYGLKDEYLRLNATLGRLYAVLEEFGSKPPLVCVPGNHDLVRPKSQPAVEVLSDWRSKGEVRSDFWRRKRTPYHRCVAKAFENYVAWKSQHPFPRLQEKHGYLPGDFSAILPSSEAKIGFVGLNTSFLQLKAGDYMGRLSIHPKQLQEACGDSFADWLDGNDVNFLLTHHPFEWLDPEAQDYFNAEIYPPDRFAMHLFGHMHESQLTSIWQGGQVKRRLQAPSLFGLEKYKDVSVRNHGFSILSLENSDNKVNMRVWPRRLERHQAGHRHFIQDVGYTLDKKGYTESIHIGSVKKMSKKIESSHTATTQKARFSVSIFCTEPDLGEAKVAIAQYLEKALGVDVVNGVDSGVKCDLSILIQSWWWDEGKAAHKWELSEARDKILFLVSDAADWPPRRLIESKAEPSIKDFLARHTEIRQYDKPADLPELIGEVIADAISRTANEGDHPQSLKKYERAYLNFRAPAWVAGRTAGRQHVLELDANELYKPELYIPLAGYSPNWHWPKDSVDGAPVRTSAEQANQLAAQHEVFVPLAKWISFIKSKRITFVGAPGGGKTVFLTRIAATLAYACLGRPGLLEQHLDIEKLRSESGLAPIPIVLEATRIDKKASAGMRAVLLAVAEEFEQAGQMPPVEEIDAGLKEGRYFLLIDALDEIPDTRRRIALLDILKGISAAEHYEKTGVLLATRSARYTGALALGPEFEIVDVMPFFPDQVNSFCDIWSLVRKKDAVYKADLLTAVHGLAMQVEKDGQEQAVISNPLMLTAICMVFERYQALPDDRARLCSLLVDDLCRSRTSEDSEHGWKMSDANKRDLLERIALGMQEKGAQVWTSGKALEMALRGVPQTEPLRAQRAERHLHWAAEHTGLLRFQQPESGEEEVRFWHRLFREFLAASRLAQQDMTVNELINQLWDEGRLTDPFWEDVIRMLPRALGTIEKANSFASGLKKLAIEHEKNRGRLLGLLAAGVIESRDLFAEVNVAQLAADLRSCFEQEGHSWPLRDRLLFLDGLANLNPDNMDFGVDEEKWIEVPAGRLLDGGKSPRFSRHLKHSYNVAPTFVTVRQFWMFLEAAAKDSGEYWGADPAMKNRATVIQLSIDWRKQLRYPNRPVVNINVWDAMAYCKWRTAFRKDGGTVRLMTMEEHFRLAAFAGLSKSKIRKVLSERDEQKAIANTPNFQIGRCTPVSAFPAWTSDGLEDIIGNVLEFTQPSTLTKGKSAIVELGIWKGCHIPIGPEGINGNGVVRLQAGSHYDFSASFVGFRCALVFEKNKRVRNTSRKIADDAVVADQESRERS